MTSAARGLVSGAEQLVPAQPVASPKPMPGKIIPCELGPTGQNFSDAATLMLEGMALANERVAADAAAGYADAYARFALRHPDAFE